MHEPHQPAPDSTRAKKQRAARAALKYVQPDTILGIGTGTTVNELIELLALQTARLRLRGTVSSSEGVSARLRAHGIPVLDLNTVGDIPLYIDSADETNRDRELIKGGGGALTREKIVAAAATRFICIVDDSKLVATLGRFPLPVEVIPMARSHIAARLEQLGGRPLWREGVITDNGNHILDVHGLSIVDAIAIETAIDQIAGVVTVGLFARRPADLLIIGKAEDVEEI